MFLIRPFRAAICITKLLINPDYSYTLDFICIVLEMTIETQLLFQLKI